MVQYKYNEKLDGLGSVISFETNEIEDEEEEGEAGRMRIIATIDDSQGIVGIAHGLHPRAGSSTRKSMEVGPSTRP